MRKLHAFRDIESWVENSRRNLFGNLERVEYDPFLQESFSISPSSRIRQGNLLTSCVGPSTLRRKSTNLSDTLSSGKERSRALHATKAGSTSLWRSALPFLLFWFCRSVISRSSKPCKRVSVCVRVA